MKFAKRHHTLMTALMNTLTAATTANNNFGASKIDTITGK